MEHLLELLPDYLTGHLQLTLLALLAAVVISVPLGVAASRLPRIEGFVLGVAGVIQTIPSLALLAAMVPLLALLDLPSIGFLPAIIGLTLYGLLPILRNTVTGLHEVDPALKEAARGVGMTSGQQLRRVEIPLAWPSILAGIRISTQMSMGILAIAAYAKGPGLGNLIFAALSRVGTPTALPMALTATVLIVVLALVLDALLVLLGRLTIRGNQ